MRTRGWVFAAVGLLAFACTADAAIIGGDDFDGGGTYLSRTITPDNSGNSPPGSFPGSWWDVFGIYGRNTGVNYDFADDSAGTFPGDTMGVLKVAKTDNVFGIEDLTNGDNPGGTGTADWTFDIDGETTVYVEVDMTAMGDFEQRGHPTATPDLSDWKVSLNGTDWVTIFYCDTFSEAQHTYIMESGTPVTIDDPWNVNGLLIDNDWRTMGSREVLALLGGTGTTLYLKLDAQGDGGNEVIAFDNVVIRDDARTGACCALSGCVADQTADECYALPGIFDGHGVFLGPGTTCDGDPCTAYGACCVGETCTTTTEADCAGVYQGDGTTCDPDNPCAGACCVEEACTDSLDDGETKKGCDDAGGMWFYDATCADINECVTPDLIISEIMDGTLTGGLPKFVEVTNMSASPIDLQHFSLGNYPNESPYLGGGEAYQLQGMLPVGESYVFAYEDESSSEFANVYGFAPDQFAGGAYINGNDVVALFFGQATGYGDDARLIDIYGVVGECTGSDDYSMAWAYNNSYAYRLTPITSANATFDIDEWFVPGFDMLNYGDATQVTQGMQVRTSPDHHPYEEDTMPYERIRGACCYNSVCQHQGGWPYFLTEEECDALPGNWLGAWTICEPDPCGTPTGACCLDYGEVPSCYVMSQADCENDPDYISYVGDWIECDGNPCISRSLIISEVVDGTLTGGQPKFVEIKNTGDDPIELMDVSIGNFSNGSTLLGGGASTMLAVNSTFLDPGEFYLIAYEVEPTPPATSMFEYVYNMSPDMYMGGGWINGNDVIALFVGEAEGSGSDALMIDVFGEIGQDGVGECWEYTDSYAYRNCGVTDPNPIWVDCSEWTLGGPDALEGADDPASLLLLRQLTTPDYAGCKTCGGDMDGSKNVDFGDLVGFVAELLSADPDPCADVNGDCEVNGQDIQEFVDFVMANGGNGTPCYPPIAIHQCSDVGGTGPDCSTIYDYCHWTVTATSMPDWCVDVGILSVGNVICLPCDVHCPDSDPVIFHWMEYDAPGGSDCYFEATPTPLEYCEPCYANPSHLKFAYDE